MADVSTKDGRSHLIAKVTHFVANVMAHSFETWLTRECSCALV